MSHRIASNRFASRDNWMLLINSISSIPHISPISGIDNSECFACKYSSNYTLDSYGESLHVFPFITKCLLSNMQIKPSFVSDIIPKLDLHKACELVSILSIILMKCALEFSPIP